MSRASKDAEKSASRGLTVGSDSGENKDDCNRKEETPIMYAPAGEGESTYHPVTLARWNCKEETLTSNTQTWGFLQEYRELRAKLDG